MTFKQAKARLAYLAGTNDYICAYSDRVLSGVPSKKCAVTMWDGPTYHSGSGKTWEIAFADLSADMAGPDPTEAPDAEGVTA